MRSFLLARALLALLFLVTPAAHADAAQGNALPANATQFSSNAVTPGDSATVSDSVPMPDALTAATLRPAPPPAETLSWLPWPAAPLGYDAPSMGNASRPPPPEPLQAQASVEQVQEDGGVLLRTLLGLLSVFALAWLAAHPAVRKAEKNLGFEHVIGAGLPFVFLGLLLRSDWIGVLDNDVLHHLAPLFEFGLGWLGFLVGFRFNSRFLDSLPRGMPTVIAVTTSLPFVMVLLTCGGLMLVFAGASGTAAVLRDAVVLAAASAMTAARSAEGHSYCASQRSDADVVSLTEQLDEIASVIALLFLTAYFRPEGDAYTWRLPGTAWIFIALGMGVALGFVIHVMLRQRSNGSEFLAITLGSVAFAAGMADYLWLSPIVVCFIAGSVVANLPLAQSKAQLWAILARVEWPLYLVFLTCVGAFWDITDWRGWLLVPVFVAARMIGKWMSIGALSKAPIDHQYDGLLAGRTVFARMSGLSIAMVVGWESLYGGSSGRWIVTAVVGGAVVLEFLAHGWERGSRRWLRMLEGFGSAAPPHVTGAVEAASPPAVERVVPPAAPTTDEADTPAADAQSSHVEATS